MIGTNLPRKRNEHGASLLLLVSIIGLAFIVTLAAMLVAASNGQDTARLASAKVDVANREDVLMREILRETATGILNTTPETWTTIMHNATTNNRLVTNYVDKQELTDLGITGVTTITTANTGDTGGANLLDIFQGYTGAPHDADVPWSEVPFGGTSGPAGRVPNLAVDSNGNVIDPPLMNWSGNLTLNPANATFTPQEFFLGSLNTAGTPPTQSRGNRWAQLTYPAIRFGYKQAGDKFIARRVWWRIPLVYNTTQQTVEDQKVPPVYRYPSAPANYVLSVYEIPSQLPISGNANLQIGLNDDGTTWGSGITIAGPSATPGSGSIYGGQIQLYAGTYRGVSSRQQVKVVNPATVGGVTYSSDSTDSAFDQPGTREQMALTQTPGAAAPVSVAGNDGKVLLVPVMPGNDFYMAAPGNNPTHWDLYARPYYRCRIRIIISGTDSNLIYNSLTGQTTAGPITVTVYCSPDTSSPSPRPDQILGFPDTSAGTPAVYTQSNLPSYMNYTSTDSTITVPGRNILVIDVGNMVATLGGGTLAQAAPTLYSIYIGSNPTTANDPGVAIMDTNDLSAFSNGLSIVTNQTLYLLDAFNQVIPVGATTPCPTSIYAPQVRYGISQINPQVNLTGQVAVIAKPDPTNPVRPLSFPSNSQPSLPSSNITATLTEVTDPMKIPPITALNLLFTIEKERTN